MKKSAILPVVVCMLVMSSNTSAELADGLIAYWPLDEGAGITTADRSPAEYGFHGTLVGGPTWTGGQFGNALNFDGADDYVLCAERQGTGPGAYPEELMPENFTIACWVNLDQFRYYFNSLVGNGMDTGGNECGFFLYEWGWVGDEGNDFGLALRTESGSMLYLESPAVYNEGTWYHVAATYDSTTSEAKLYVDGADVGVDTDGSASGAIVWVSPTSGNYPERFAIGVWLDPGYDLWIDGTIDDVGYWDRPLTADEISTIYSKGEPILPPPNPALADEPIPDDKAQDVARDVMLKWTPGAFAPTVNGHKVYFSNNSDDVTNGAASADRGLTSDPEFDTLNLPFALDFETTYYWRIDEANSVTGWDQGIVWRFTTEPSAYPIASQNITAAASSSHSADMGPEKTIDGSGLNDDDEHSTVDRDMWLSSGFGAQPTWIQYEFDSAYVLHEMWVWNSNQSFEPWVGFGLKDVTIEYSMDGTNWTELADVPEFARATGSDDYTHNTTVPFGDVLAKYVKITANSNWGDVTQYGLSEVRFLYIPVQARYPNPRDGATNVGPDVVLGFRAGRKAATHKLYLSTNEQAVTEGTFSPVSIPVTRSEANYDVGTLELGRTYYWKVNEVNEAETPTTWQGDLWSFATPEYFVVEDVEDYNDYPPHRAFDTWSDGFYVSTNGSQVGYDSAPYMESDIVHGGSQSMPFLYDNTTSVAYSEADANIPDLGIHSDWTYAGVKALTLYFYGDPDNTVGATERMYVKLNGVKLPYDGDMADIKQASWHEWNVDLASFSGVNLQNVTKIGIGLDRGTGPGGKGTLILDDIRLYPSRCVPSRAKPAADLNNDCQVDFADLQMVMDNWLISTYGVVPADPGTGNLIGHWKFDEGSGATTQDSSGQGNHGGLDGGVTWTTGQPGFGSALSFDGVDNYVYCAERAGAGPGIYPATLMPSTFTISCWAKVDTFAYFGALVGNGEDTGSDECGFFLYNYGWVGENGQDFGLSIKTGAGGMVYVETPNIYETDTWYHVAATYDGSNANVYVNGALAAGPVDVGGPMQWLSENSGNYPERFSIGAYIDSDEEYWVDGTIDEVRYYKTALSHGQVGWLAGETAPYSQPIHMLLTPTQPAINMYDGDAIPVIDLKDFAALAQMWLDQQLWP
jgi:hypothetical protein